MFEGAPVGACYMVMLNCLHVVLNNVNVSMLHRDFLDCSIII